MLASVRIKGVKLPVQRRGIFDTRGEAVDWEIDTKRALKQLGLGPCSLKDTLNVSTFDEAVDLYVEALNAKGKGAPKYRKMIEYIKGLFGRFSLDRVPDALRTHRVAHVGKLKAPTLNRHTAVIRAVFGYLAALDIIPKNPINNVLFPKFKETPRDRVLTVDERRRLFAAIEAHRPHLLPLITYLLAVPCRARSELLPAMKSQYSPLTKTLFIPTSKNGESITKPVPPETAAYIKSIPDACPYLFYRQAKNGGYLPITDGSLRKDWAAVLAAAGVDDYHIHDTRHEAATALCLAGNNTRAVMSAGGWKTLDMLTRYHHIDAMRDAQSIVFTKPDIEVRTCKASS